MARDVRQCVLTSQTSKHGGGRQETLRKDVLQTGVCYGEKGTLRSDFEIREAFE